MLRVFLPSLSSRESAPLACEEGCFVICWTPGLVVLLLDGLGCEQCMVLRYEKYCLVLAECNSFVNPIIYSFRDKDMRSTFKQILCCLCRRGSNHQGNSGVQFSTLEHEKSKYRSAVVKEKSNGVPLICDGSEDIPASSEKLNLNNDKLSAHEEDVLTHI
ncbi:lysophosphatidic acid receptor 2-like protein [Lates japonicus]|uniref:Lysophosphatidic acid receptor 2-like protein n=1 Tax=Lates japonicus TaxID=270547 RepID=A0AAD3NL33_LATJO|nr:lysophosphatidic acid receptor 2-like protein [Lates japonicus]GLD74999.1 lysophosphatidic acid receptor 2-like protein [Lates japonicus]